MVKSTNRVHSHHVKFKEAATSTSLRGRYLAENEWVSFKVVSENAKRYSGSSRRRIRKALWNQTVRLQRTQWWFLSSHFGFWARDESRKLCREDLKQVPETGREPLLWWTEKGKQSEQWTVKLVTDGLSLQSSDKIKNEPIGSFYLAVNQKWRSDEQICYMRSPVGKKQLGRFLSDTVSAGGFQPGKIQPWNYSVGKTSIGRLLDVHFPEDYVVQLSGHKHSKI